MRLLLDTHALLWWLAADTSMSEKAVAAVSSPDSTVYVSAATVWEIEIKRAKGRLEAPDDLENQLARHRFQTLDMTFRHALAAGRLPRLHSDPFDRMLVAQAIIEELVLVTRDPLLSKSGATVLSM